MQAMNNKDELLKRLNYLKRFNFVNKSTLSNINTFINFILRSCKEFQFYIDNMTCEAESSVSLFKSFYTKRYTTFGLNTILHFIKTNKTFNYVLINMNDYTNNEILTYEPIVWRNEFNKYLAN
ncbi:UNVERIFIED_CONTAM: hypothetical protein O8I53_13990 [Campylobacter lari]